MSDTKLNLVSGRRLALNILWNFLGGGAPLLVAFVAIPILIEGLGTARFGVLTIAWMVVGYFSLFDMGLGRALTKLIAEKLGKRQNDEIPKLIWTAILLMAVFGLLGSITIVVLSPWLVGKVLKIPLELQPETLNAFYLLAASVPFVISATGLCGVLGAHQRFGLINAVRVPLGIFTFLGPMLVLPFSKSLVPVVMVLVVARLVSLCTYVALCLHIVPTLRKSVSVSCPLIKSLLNFGGWMTITNIVGPLMIYLDRFFIGSMISMTSVAYYTTPYEVINKLGIVPTALMGVLFPAFATTFVQNRVTTVQLFERAVNYIFLFLFPVVIIIVTFAHEGLTIWLGREFADKSYVVLQLLAIGVFINSHAHVPFGLLQSAGRPDITAKFHLIEFPFYLLLLWWLLGVYGIVGAAIAWVIRISLDAMLLFIMAQRLLATKGLFIQTLVFKLCSALFAMATAAMISEVVVKEMFLVALLPIFVIIAWLYILNKDDKSIILNFLKLISIFKFKKIF